MCKRTSVTLGRRPYNLQEDGSSEATVLHIACSPSELDSRSALAIGKAASPSWHRRARKQRSRLRQRVRAAKIRGGRVPWRTVLRLSRHHSRPFTQLLPMGKTSWEQKGQWKGQEGGGSPSWAYANKWTRGNPSSAGSGQPEKDRAFPAYNQMTTSGTEVEGAGKDGDQASPQIHDPFIKSMQKFLNQSRKLDAKMRKAVSDRQEMGRQWAEFQQKLRESFVEQRQKYLADSSKMDQELAELQQQKKDSLQLIHDLVATKDAVPQEKVKGSAGAGFQQEKPTKTTTMTTAGAVSRRPIILDDDQDGAKEPGGSVANDLSQQ